MTAVEIDEHIEGSTAVNGTPAIDTPLINSPLPEAMPKEMEPTSRLHDLARALMLDEDPSRLIICMEVRSFFSLMNMVIDKLLCGGLSLHQFRLLLDPRTALIRDTGYPELAQAIADDLDYLEAKFQRLQELQATGASSYVAARADARLEAWRGARAFTGLEVQMQRDRVDQIGAVVAKASSSLNHLHSCFAVSEGRIAELRRELQAEEENLGILELTRANKEEALTVASRDLSYRSRSWLRLRRQLQRR